MRKLFVVALALATAACGKGAGTQRDDPAKPTVVARDGVLAAGEHYVVALDGDGRVFGWGGYEERDGTRTLSSSKRPRLIAAGSGYKRVAAGRGAIYLIDAESRLRRVALAAATASEPATPQLVFAERHWQLAIQSGRVGVGIERDGTLSYWSDEDLGRTLRGENSGDTAERARPRALMKGVRFVDACLQGARAFAVSADGDLYRSDALTDYAGDRMPKQGERWDLTEIPSDATLTRVYCGTNVHHGLALDDRGHAWSFGWNYSGELGIGAPDGFNHDSGHEHPLERISEQRFVALAVGRQVSFAIARDGALWGWGENGEHELGLGDRVSRHEPTRIDDARAYVAIGAAVGTGIAIASSGEAFAWGGGTLGALGDGGVASSLERPTAVLSDERFGGVVP